MSGLAASRFFLALGWVGLVAGIGYRDIAVAAIIGGALLIVFGLFGIDTTRPARTREERKREFRRRDVRLTTPRG